VTARIKQPTPTFSYLECLRRADEALERPPTWDWVKRVSPVGDPVKRFALPLDYCPTSNVRMRGGKGQRFKEAAIKRACFSTMLGQNGGRKQTLPLKGRPFVRAIRFTTTATDRESDWLKIPLDRLCCGPTGLCYLEDDSEKHIDVVKWCEQSKRNEGFVVIEIYTGEAS
jgi:hypothetical protein